MTPETIARLEVTLNGVEPKVKRRLDVPADIRLDRLHETIQAAFGWEDSHLWEFRARDVQWGIPDPDWPDGPLNAKKATLWDLFEDTGAKTLRYLYDFGDGWEHVVKIAKFDDPDPTQQYPLLLEAEGRCPPEDIGGPWGYQDFLEAIKDPSHENHEDVKEWWADDFDPKDVPIEDLKADVAHLAKKWARKPRKQKPSK